MPRPTLRAEADAGTSSADGFPVTEEKNSEMNWVEFSGMKDEDLGAIWDYLETLPPLELIRYESADPIDPEAPVTAATGH